MDESQRAMVAAKMANMPQGERTDLEPSANLQKVSQADAAALLNVSTRSVAAAVKIRASAVPEVVRACEQGIVPVSHSNARIRPAVPLARCGEYVGIGGGARRSDGPKTKTRLEAGFYHAAWSANSTTLSAPRSMEQTCRAHTSIIGRRCSRRSVR